MISLTLQKVFSVIDRDLNSSINLLKDFVAQPSVCATGEGVRDMARMLGEVLKELGFSVSYHETPTKAPIIHAVLKGKEEKTLMFYNHYDVQPPDPLSEWESPPFEPVVRDGKLFGRGVNDNKGNIVARIAALKAVTEVFGESPLTVRFVIEGDEECSSRGFSGFIDECREELRADGCIWESGYVDKDGRLQMYAGMKGILYVEFVARGAERDLHSSMGTIIPNPAWRLVWALSTIKGPDEKVLIEGFYDDVADPAPEDIRALEEVPFDEEFLKDLTGVKEFTKKATGLQLKIEHFFKPTATIDGLVSGYIGEGSKTVLPSRAVAKLDFRLVPNQDPHDIFEKLRQHLARHGFSDIEVKLLGAEHPGKSPINSEIAEVAAKAAERVYEKPPVLLPMTVGSGPFYYVANKLGVPTISAGIGYYDSKAHAPNENIRIEDFRKGIKHMAAVICMFAESRVS